VKVPCDNCKEVIQFVPSLDELRVEIKELILDRAASLTEEELIAYIDQLYDCVTQAIQDSVDHSKAQLRTKRSMAAKKYGRQATENKQ
jgi:hypothetical protein